MNEREGTVPKPSIPSAAVITEWTERLAEKQVALDRARQALSTKELENIELIDKIDGYEDALTELGVKVDQLDGEIDVADALSLAKVKKTIDGNDDMWEEKLAEAAAEQER